MTATGKSTISLASSPYSTRLCNRGLYTRLEYKADMQWRLTVTSRHLWEVDNHTKTPSYQMRCQTESPPWSITYNTFEEWDIWCLQFTQYTMSQHHDSLNTIQTQSHRQTDRHTEPDRQYVATKIAWLEDWSPIDETTSDCLPPQSSNKDGTKKQPVIQHQPSVRHTDEPQ